MTRQLKVPSRSVSIAKHATVSFCATHSCRHVDSAFADHFDRCIYPEWSNTTKLSIARPDIPLLREYATKLGICEKSRPLPSGSRASKSEEQEENSTRNVQPEMSPVGSPQCGTLFSLSLSHYHHHRRLPLLSVSDIVELDVPVRRVGGHDNPPGSDREQNPQNKVLLRDLAEKPVLSTVAVEAVTSFLRLRTQTQTRTDGSPFLFCLRTNCLL